MDGEDRQTLAHGSTFHAGSNIPHIHIGMSGGGSLCLANRLVFHLYHQIPGQSVPLKRLWYHWQHSWKKSSLSHSQGERVGGCNWLDIMFTPLANHV